MRVLYKYFKFFMDIFNELFNFGRFYHFFG